MFLEKYLEGIELFGIYGDGGGGGSNASVCALAAVPLLAKHEQKPPSAEQPFSKCRGGEEQGTVTSKRLVFNSP